MGHTLFGHALGVVKWVGHFHAAVQFQIKLFIGHDKAAANRVIHLLQDLFFIGVVCGKAQTIGVFGQAFCVTDHDVTGNNEFNFVFAIKRQAGLAVDVGQAFWNAVQIYAVRHFAFKAQ